MDAQRVDSYLITQVKFFSPQHLNLLREQMLQMDESRFVQIQMLSFNDPTITLLISIFAGSFGIDRFIIGDTGLGIGKLLTCGGLGIWTIIDWFLIMDATKEKNFRKIAALL
ncbi:TM2 domain protein [Sphingobacterium spiritivorum ATCC 33300]|uniref:TM2 domain protein n=1 Tax=Sphingobacterium spiritivorum ATCC 33300 TaxID=525372 RepID=C2G167_SPHSI|nr:TM2 domain-containing protein [Sphingobacterium spiritivorum]EEI91044.1 TM2 domain protein [Sphingobacterium spiritivorum ATCC 33300]QQS97677.1 TM2 domain-containing protein [Sphingobacterium spiritivorum]